MGGADVKDLACLSVLRRSFGVLAFVCQLIVVSSAKYLCTPDALSEDSRPKMTGYASFILLARPSASLFFAHMHGLSDILLTALEHFGAEEQQAVAVKDYTLRRPYYLSTVLTSM